MPKKLKRHYGLGHPHFLTFSCYQRLPLLDSAAARDHFVRVLDRTRERYEFMLVGYVVMPNHVHLLISESSMGTPSVVLKVLKQRVARDLRKVKSPTRKTDVWGTLGTPASLVKHLSMFSKQEKSLPRFWQTRFYDFNVWSHAKLFEKLEYMHANPVTKRLVEHPKDWPWSSWSFYGKGETGLIRIDPVAFGKVRKDEIENPHT